MRLSKRTEYGLRAVIQLARHGADAYVQSRDLAQEEHLPNKFLESILLALKRGEFLESKVGSGGGYRLARPAREIRVGDLIRRLEGRLAAKDPIPRHDISPGEAGVRFISQRLTEVTDEFLDEMTLEQLLDHVSRVGTVDAMYYI